MILLRSPVLELTPILGQDQMTTRALRPRPSPTGSKCCDDDIGADEEKMTGSQGHAWIVREEQVWVLNLSGRQLMSSVPEKAKLTARISSREEVTAPLGSHPAQSVSPGTSGAPEAVQ